jgi:hypothetical protein
MQRLRRAQSKVSVSGALVSILLLIGIVGLSLAITSIAMERHIIVDLYHWQRHHPRLMHAAPYLIVGLVYLLPPILLWRVRYSWRKNGPLSTRSLKLNEFLDVPLPVRNNWTADEAWFAVNQLDGVEFRFAGSKPGHWRIAYSDASTRTLRMELDYMHVLGKHTETMHARALTCSATVRGGGMSAEVVLVFHAGSVMDYEMVREIIERTKSELTAPTLNKIRDGAGA